MTVYRTGIDGSEVDPALLKAASHLEASYQVAERLQEIRRNNEGFSIRVIREGLPDVVDHT